MIRGTTPTHTFTIPFDKSFIAKVCIVYSQDGTVVLKKETDHCTVEDRSVAVTLTQEDTLAFDCSRYVDIQVRILTTGGDALASDIIRTTVSRCLDNEVIG